MWPMAMRCYICAIINRYDEISNSSNLSSHRCPPSYVRAHPPVEEAAEERRRAMALVHPIQLQLQLQTLTLSHSINPVPVAPPTIYDLSGSSLLPGATQPEASHLPTWANSVRSRLWSLKLRVTRCLARACCSIPTHARLEETFRSSHSPGTWSQAPEGEMKDRFGVTSVRARVCRVGDAEGLSKLLDDRDIETMGLQDSWVLLLSLLYSTFTVRPGANVSTRRGSRLETRINRHDYNFHWLAYTTSHLPSYRQC